MLFNSWELLNLRVLTLGLYYLRPLSAKKVWQVTVLLVASALLYAWEEPRLLILLRASCPLNAVAVERILFWKAVGRTQPDPPTSPSSAGGFNHMGQCPLHENFLFIKISSLHA